MKKIKGNIKAQRRHKNSTKITYQLLEITVIGLLLKQIARESTPK